MQRYFINDIKQNITYLTNDDIHHTKKVMRNTNGDKIICVDDSGNNYLCKIVDIDNGQVSIVETIDNDSELDIKVTLIYALPKGDKFELVIQKATELGVHTIVPLLTNRCVVKTTPEKFKKKKIRYQKIVKEASEQSYRNHIPNIEDVISIKEIENYKSKYNLVAYEEDAKVGEHKKLPTILKQLQPKDSITIIVGCEGGFEEKEIETMKTLGIHSCSLGKRILRSETAPLYMLSVIGYIRELGEPNGVI
ncbi:MAG: RsmE family RNA methyltransferase [Coprobacillaceae bacterium]